MRLFLKTLAYLLGVQILALLFMTCFRIEFFLSVRGQLDADVVGRTGWIFKSFLHGMWFDNVIACYIMALPLVVACLVSFFNLWRSWIYKAFNFWFVFWYTIVFMGEAGNIPYFNYFSKLLNASIWNWAEYGTTTLGMILGEVSYYIYIISFIIAVGLFSFALRFLRVNLFRFTGESIHEMSFKGVSWPIRGCILLCSVFFLSACLLGIRGRLGYNPIKVSAAYFCTSPVLNNLGVNPVFCLLTSTLDEMRPENKTLHLMENDLAVKQVQQFYGRNGIDSISPIARKIIPQGKPNRKNVVIILMESMSAKLMGRFGNTKQLTPYLDSLYNKSLSFANFYSAGNHTNHGLYATLYSFPSIMFRNAMKGSDIPVYSGLPTVLKENGYSTLFFMTHESQYDNMNAFFRTNGYDEIYAQENYPKERIVNHFGVPDDYLFSYALPVLRERAAQGGPFMATLLTISNHPPYVIPEQYQDAGLQPEEQIVRYADDCIRQFMNVATQEEWGKETIFVLLGDHGKLVGAADCELPESFNHIPLIIYSGDIVAQERTDFAGQVDVAPTLLSLLNLPYVQNNFGIDLMNERRPAAFYSADKTIASRDNQRLYVYNAETQTEFCYMLHEGKPKETVMSPEFATLKNYVYSLLQTTEYMVQQGMTTD